MNYTERQPSMWHGQFDTTLYDRTPRLYPRERVALKQFADDLIAPMWWPPHGHPHLEALERLLVPIEQILAITHCPTSFCTAIKRFLLLEMLQRQTAFWEWSCDQWSEIVAPDPRTFRQRTPTSHDEIRLYLAAMSYLLDRAGDIDQIRGIAYRILAHKAFGEQRVNAAVQQVVQALHTIGRTTPSVARVAATTVSYALLANRSPLLEDLTTEFLEALRQVKTDSYLRRGIVTLSQALAHMEVITCPLEHLRSHSSLQSFRENASPDERPDARAVVHHEKTPLACVIDVTQYDRRLALTEEEYATLEVMHQRLHQGIIQWRGEWRVALERLITPLSDVVSCHATNRRGFSTVHVLLEEMYRRKTSYWAWSTADWLAIIGGDQQQFRRYHGATGSSRMMVAAVGYLLGGVREITLLTSLHTICLAKHVFGAAQIEGSFQQVLGHAEEHLETVREAFLPRFKSSGGAASARWRGR